MINFNEILYLSPEIIVGSFAFVIIIIDLILGKK